MKRLVGTALCLFLGMGSLGCDRLMKERKRVESLLGSASVAASVAPPPANAPAVATTAAPVPTTPAVSDAQIPAPEDFEEAASKEITAANAQAEFDRLKKEIGP